MIIEERGEGEQGNCQHQRIKERKEDSGGKRSKEQRQHSLSPSVQSIVERISPSHSNSNLIITGIHAMRNVLDSS